MAEAATCGYCGAPRREVVDGACAFCRTPVVAGTGAPPGAAAADAASTGTGVVLHPAGRRKINVIKAVRTCTGMDLKSAKDLVEVADDGPALIARNLTPADAQAMVDEINRAGGRAELAPA